MLPLDFQLSGIYTFRGALPYSASTRFQLDADPLLAGEILRGKFRNTFTKPEPMQPDQVTPLTFTLGDRFHTFRKGHRLMVQIQSSWFPMFDRSPQTFVDIYHAKAPD